MTHSTIEEKQQRPIRAAVFSSVEQAEDAIKRLLAAGFAREQITVVTSEEGIRRHFNGFKPQDPAGAHTEEAVAIGSSFGAALGAIGMGAVGLALGGVPLIVVLAFLHP